MIVHNGKTWATTDDKIYHGSKLIEKVYHGDKQIYPGGEEQESFQIVCVGDAPVNIRQSSGDVTIDYGDGTTWTGRTVSTIHRYSDSDEHTVTITGPVQIISFREGSRTGVRRIIGKLPSSLTSAAYLFLACTMLESIPAGLFDKCAQVTDFSYCFNECNSITSIPHGLFDNCTQATTFAGCFWGCVSITSIPAGLFDNCTQATTFEECFGVCRALRSIPAGLFDNCTLVVSFSYCFYLCSDLTGYAPALWERANTPRGSGCFSGCTNLANYNDIPSGWK